MEKTFVFELNIRRKVRCTEEQLKEHEQYFMDNPIGMAIGRHDKFIIHRFGKVYDSIIMREKKVKLESEKYENRIISKKDDVLELEDL